MTFAQTRTSVAYLRDLPPLRLRQAVITPACKMCGGVTQPFCELDFNTACDDPGLYDPAGMLVRYVRCTVCECLFTDFCDHWTAKDFKDLIYNDQYIIVDGEYDGTRALRDADFMAGLLAEAKTMRLLDYGSGLGHFARGMAAHGFAQTASYDPYSSPARPTGLFDIITSFETIEHSADPVGTIRDMLSMLRPDGCLLIGQTLQPNNIAEIGGRWSYLGPRNGHITTFSYETIRAFADREDLVFDNLGDLFALSRPGRAAYFDALLVPRIVPSYRAMLFAPRSTDAAGWHEVEQSHLGDFRWTAAAKIKLGFLNADRETELVLPILDPNGDAFLDHIELLIGDDRVRLQRRGHDLGAVFTPPAPGDYELTLLTPAPFRPVADGVETDGRRLGMGILCLPTEDSRNPRRANLWKAQNQD